MDTLRIGFFFTRRKTVVYGEFKKPMKTRNVQYRVGKSKLKVNISLTIYHDRILDLNPCEFF